MRPLCPRFTPRRAGPAGEGLGAGSPGLGCCLLPWLSLGGLGVCQAPDVPVLGAAQPPGGDCKGLETLGQGGGFCLPCSSPEGSWLGFLPSSSTERVPGDLADPTAAVAGAGDCPTPASSSTGCPA